MTSLILAVLTADVGSSFSIYYQPAPDGYVLDSNAMLEILDAFYDNYETYLEFDTLLFDYNDPERSDYLAQFGDSWLEDGYGYGDYGVIGEYDEDGMGIMWAQASMDVIVIFSDKTMYAPEDCSSLFEYVPKVILNNFNMDNAKKTDKMFANCETVDLIDCNFANVTSAKNMFEGVDTSVLINESLLANENINNPTDNPELYNSTHNENGEIHMTANSQFVLPAVDLTELLGTEPDGSASSWGLQLNSGFIFNYYEIATVYGICFETYTTPGNYINSKNKYIAYEYNSLALGKPGGQTSLAQIGQVSGVTDNARWNSFQYSSKHLQFYAEFVNIYYDESSKNARLYFISNSPIYLINAPDFVKNASDWQSAIVGTFANKNDEEFYSSFNNVNIKFWG